MTLRRQQFALLFATPQALRRRGRVFIPGASGWGQHYPELQLMGEIEVVNMAEIPAGLARWQAIAAWIGNHGSRFDGVIIVHDRTSLIPAAVALDLQLSSVTMPVVMTIAPGEHTDDWRTNVVVALQTAVVDVPGPIVLDGNRIVRAGTVIWEFLNVIGGASAARLDFGVRRVPTRLMPGAPIKIHPLATDMLIWNVVPGLSVPPIPKTPPTMLLQCGLTPDWSALGSWYRALPRGSRIIIQWAGRNLPKAMSGCGHIASPDDQVAIVQAAWAFGQGNQWKRYLKTAHQRRRV